MASIMVDSCVFVAALNSKDKNHNEGKTIMEKILKKQTTYKFVINDYILDEVVTYLRKKVGYDISIKVLNLLLNQNYFTLLKVTEENLKAAYFFFKRYDGLSFTDACILSTMISNNIKKIISFDSNFDIIKNIERINSLSS